MSLVQSIIVLLLLVNNSWATSKTLDQLLQEVKQAQLSSKTLNHTREAKFLAEKQYQQQRLTKAQISLKQQETLSHQLKQQLEDNETLLTQLETQLKQRSGELGELFGVARQAAGDLKAELDHSLISAQYPGRSQKLSVLANSKTLPTIEQLETLWFSLQQEMTESGKITRYQATIESADGHSQAAEVTRVGVFNAIANGQFLRFSPETNRLITLARQPDSQYTDLAQAYSQATQEPAEMVVDPTGGVMLSMLIQTPNTRERIQQGGIIGYIILALGVVGLIYAGIRLLILTLTGRKMQQQMNTPTAMDNNPLGRVLIAAEQNTTQAIESLELILDEAITREIPNLEKGLSIIKLMAAVAPLLGLLGTVTGMISTFQSISLFGTGDPKLMANGISQALVTTMLGLCVAIPLLFLHSLVSSRSKILVQILDEQSAGLMSRRAGQ